jgi:ATP-dependent Lon protease
VRAALSVATCRFDGSDYYHGLLVGRSIAPGLVVLGQMSIHGVLNRVEGLADKLRISLDAGAKRILIPTESRRDFAELPAELIDKLQIDFYSDPAKAAFKAFAEI